MKASSLQRTNTAKSKPSCRSSPSFLSCSIILLGVNVHLIGNFLLYIALVLTIFSGLNYFYKFYGIWRENDRAA